MRIGCVDPADHVLVRVEIRKPFVKEDPRESCETFRIFRLFLSVGWPFEVNSVIIKLKCTDACIYTFCPNQNSIETQSVNII